MVGTARFELATPCTPSKCATRLRYVPTESAAQDDDDSGGSTSKFYTRRPVVGWTAERNLADIVSSAWIWMQKNSKGEKAQLSML